MAKKIEREEIEKIETKASKDNNVGMFGQVWFRNGFPWFRYGLHVFLMVS